MNEKSENGKVYDLEERTFVFAKDVRFYAQSLPKTIGNMEDAKQVVRSSGSVGANYIEANESLSKKDFLMRIKICRKEAKESAYWLMLIVDTNDSSFSAKGVALVQEANELKKIFSAILIKQFNVREFGNWILFDICYLSFGIL